MKLRKSAVLSDVRAVSEMKLSETKYYMTKNIPASGCFLKSEDSRTQQLSLFEHN